MVYAGESVYESVVGLSGGRDLLVGLAENGSQK